MKQMLEKWKNTLKKQIRKAKKKRQNKPKVRYSKMVVSCLLITVLLFTITMTVIFCYKDSVPDSLVTAFFVFAGGEAGVLGVIKHGETKYSVNEPTEYDE